MGDDRRGATRLALATCAALPNGDLDDARLPEVLGGRWQVWDDPTVEWDEFDLVLVRSTWDYVPRREAFLGWARSVPRIVNPPPVLEWNTDKRYLTELAAAGLPVVETMFVRPPDALPTISTEVVVKPAISAASADSGRFPEPDAAHRHARRLLAAGRTVMIQPYLPQVERGETGLVYFGGVFSHALRKGPILAKGKVLGAEGTWQEEISPYAPAVAERGIADAVLQWVFDRFGVLPYARVDVVGDLLLELELTEPSFFFRTTTRGEERLAAALAHGGG